MAFYIYAYLRSKNSPSAKAGTPYYIGKGKDYRAWDKRHNGVRLPKHEYIIIERNLTEIGALALERFYIRWWGRKDLNTGILLNKTDGGEGASGSNRSEETKLRLSKIFLNHVVTDETKQKISLKATGRKASAETKEKFSKLRKGKASHRRGKHITAETKQKISKSTLGVKKTEGTKQKMKKPKISVQCPHCLAVGGQPAMIRWHFENCKEKK